MSQMLLDLEQPEGPILCGIQDGALTCLVMILAVAWLCRSQPEPTAGLHLMHGLLAAQMFLEGTAQEQAFQETRRLYRDWSSVT